MPHPLAKDLDHILSHTEPVWADLRGERVFITGGTGFFGTWLVESFVWANRRLALGARATILTRNPAAFTAKAPHAAADPAIELCNASLVHLEPPAGEYAYVIHAATEQYFAPTPDRPLSIFPLNIEATRRVLDFAVQCRARSVLFTSSGAAYGRQPTHLEQIPEDYPGAPDPLDLNSAYGQSKRASEFMCAMYASQHSFNAPIARPFAFVGPHLPLDSNYAIGNFIRDALNGGPIRVAGDGTPLRSYLYAADLAIWLWTLLFEVCGCDIYNVGSSEAISIAELACTVAATVAPDAAVQIAQKPNPDAPPARYVPSTRKAEQLFGLRAWIPLAEAIRRTFTWHWRAQGPGTSRIHQVLIGG